MSGAKGIENLTMTFHYFPLRCMAGGTGMAMAVLPFLLANDF